MQNKGFLWTFTALLLLTSAYQLSFSIFTSSFEGKAEVYANNQLAEIKKEHSDLTGIQEDSILTHYSEKFLKDNGDEEIYPLIGKNYQECKNSEINLGLDLQGGMSVTLEVSIPEMIDDLANHSKNEVYRASFEQALANQTSDTRDFVSIFQDAWNQNKKEGMKLVDIFHRASTKDKFDINASDDEVVEALIKDAEKALDGTVEIISNRINRFGVSAPNVQKQFATGRISVELPGVKDKARVSNLLQSTAKLEFYPSAEPQEMVDVLASLNNGISDFYYPGYKDSVDKLIKKYEEDLVKAETDTAEAIADTPSEELNLDEVLENSSNTTDFTSVAAPVFDTAKVNPIFQILSIDQRGNAYIKVGDTAQLNAYFKTAVARSIIPQDMIMTFAHKQIVDNNGLESGIIEFKALKKVNGKSLLEGDVIENVGYSRDMETGRNFVINLKMNDKGRRLWKEITTQYLQKRIAITLDTYVLTDPMIQVVIAGGNSQITGGFTFDEARDLANILNAGSLPAPAKIIEQSFVGPSLGAENIHAGFISFVIALIIVLIYMVFYYNNAGIVTDIALLLNLFLLIGILAALGASLTLPGIAGIVLTIGMAVDANVLIFERIREELSLGKDLKLAIKDGYKNSYLAIVDANVTTFLTAVVLYVFGAGPIVGFAITLIIGILTSLFSAIVFTRLLFEIFMKKDSKIKFSTKMTENVLRNAKFKFIDNRKKFYIISAIVVIGGLVSIATNSFNYGVEFNGGRKYKLKFDDKVQVENLRTSIGDAAQAIETGANVEVKRVQDDYHVYVVTNLLALNNEANADSLAEATVLNGIETAMPGVSYVLESQMEVSPTISDDVKASSIQAVIIALLIIFAYIVLRFRKWQFGTGALIALFHDVLILLGVFSLLKDVMPFSMEINEAFIAAILTVVGYSINDTVVVFDRIREFFGKYGSKDSEEVTMNKALNSTLTRTFNTSLSTLVVLIVIFTFGPENIQGFIFGLMIGVVVGTYSSLCIATPVVVDLLKLGKKK